MRAQKTEGRGQRADTGPAWRLQRCINRHLDLILPKATGHFKLIHEAMRYAVLSGGKRIRPIFVLESCRACGGDPKKAIAAACAVELIHNYSLIHDDLPCMDNDSIRRGKPTCHVKYEEETALLAGDALLTLAFEVLAEVSKKLTAKMALRYLEIIRILAHAAGTYGMIGGQALDMKYQQEEADLTTIEFINVHKTGALIAASIKMGAVLGNASKDDHKLLSDYGQTVGLLFQTVDDIIDSHGVARAMGITKAIRQSEHLLEKAKGSLLLLGKRGTVLKQLAESVFAQIKSPV